MSNACSGTAPGQEAEALNRSCFCLTLDRQALCEGLEREADDPEFCRTYVTPRSHLLSNVQVFLPRATLQAMHAVVHAIHEVSQLAPYKSRVLA